LPEGAFFMVGTIEEAVEKAKTLGGTVEEMTAAQPEEEVAG
jgi:hypothetical protein